MDKKRQTGGKKLTGRNQLKLPLSVRLREIWILSLTISRRSKKKKEKKQPVLG